MLIRVTTRACGRLTFRPGDVIDLPTPSALELIQCGAAAPVNETKESKPEEKKPEPKRRKK